MGERERGLLTNMNRLGSAAWTSRRKGAALPIAMCGVLGLALLLSLMRPGCGTGAADGEHRIRLRHGAQSSQQQQQQQQPALALTGSFELPPPVTLDAPAGPPVDLRLAHLLLPLTNLSSLSTAALLDSHPGITPAEGREVVRLHQDLYCSARMHLPDPPGSARTLFSNVTLFVYEKGDIVSDSLRGASRGWEAAEIQQMLYAIRAPVPASTSAADLANPSAWKAPASPLFIDIGANVGWFTVNAAAAGARVAAFEAMSANIGLLRATLCANPWISERVALYGTGLGTERTSCVIISDSANVGDGHVTCGQDASKVLAHWKQKTGREYVARGEISIMRLDKLIDRDVQMIKIDVEGYEPSVLKGAEGLLRDHNVWFIAAEANSDIIKPEEQAEFLKFLDAQGYYVSEASFTGPFIAVADIRAGYSQELTGVNLFCVKKALRDAVAGGEPQGRRLAAAAGGGGGGGAGSDAVWAGWLERAAAAAAA
ncbi:hypothetical protein Rsub_06986 [Raphidocelis subcapitata]|uniref:Methyltransferase FkbM domain-containing protein n=1 Tax=Raphidocelis subcapitata TaxID=307507 RepID=A0A2V0P3C1_9CHLO|nr:hypothetical protein Rsub_06986 [Raphidocelis subcapitata]|eukprot:GBF94364.1 hypothetical protein Rsub_06986 [Raphidocelis subcapitata]